MWLLVELELISTLLLAHPVVLGKEPVTLPLVSREDKALSKRLFDVARSPTQNVVLVLKRGEGCSASAGFLGSLCRARRRHAECSGPLPRRRRFAI